ncbi:MAG: ATP-binding protein [Pseudomonadota bacterium]
MTDLRLQDRIGQDDREALEHIARALEGRSLPSDHAAVAAQPANDHDAQVPEVTPPDETHELSGAAPGLSASGVANLLEAIPSAVGMLKGDLLVTANSAFAYAFGYRSSTELLQQGGLDAILPTGVSELRQACENGAIDEIAVLTQSKRRLTARFALTVLDEDKDLSLLRLVDPSELEAGMELDASMAEQDPASSEPQTEAEPGAPSPSKAAALVTTPLPDAAVASEAVVSPQSAIPVVMPALSAQPSEEARPPSATQKSEEANAAELHGAELHGAETRAEEEAPAPLAQKPNSSETEPPDMDGQQKASAARQLDFLAKVSHEVRTPLNSIIGFAELMLHERFGPIGNTRYKGYAEDIHQSGLYALSLLNDLLDISKIEAGKFELDFTSVDVAEVAEICVASLQPLAKRTRIVLRTSFADDLPKVVADPRRLRQIILNLLTNAIKFTKEGEQVIVSGTMAGRELRLRVRDSGIGMSEGDIAYAMQPFHQLDTSPRRQSGTGLGLPLTKALTDAIQARLELSSEPGVGTTADVIFPHNRVFRS